MVIYFVYAFGWVCSLLSFARFGFWFGVISYLFGMLVLLVYFFWCLGV